MRKLFSFFAVFVLLFMLACGGGKKDNIYDYPDEDSTNVNTTDGDNGEPDRKQGELYGECYPNKTCNEGLICDEENNVCIKDNGNSAKPDDDSDTDSGDTTPDQDSDTDPDDTTPDQDNDSDDNPDIDNIEISDQDSDTDTEEPEATESHQFSGAYQIGSSVSGIHAALVECGKTEELASADTDADGKFSFNANISESKTYCVKAGDFASCFKGMSDHVANISEITTAAYLVDETCADIRKSETKVRNYAKLGTGKWLGELDYSKLSGIKTGLKLLSSFLNNNDSKILSEKNRG